jgi:hypothetical protein
MLPSSQRAADGEKGGQQQKRRKDAKGRTLKKWDVSNYVQRHEEGILWAHRLRVCHPRFYEGSDRRIFVSRAKENVLA